LKYLWAAPENGVSAERVRQYAAGAVAQLNRERRRRMGLLIYRSVLVAVSTGFAAWVWLSRGVGVEEVWPVALLLAAQWVAAGLLWRALGRGPAAVAAEAPIRVTLESLRDQAARRCRELQTVLGLFLVAAPLLSFVVYQLQENGKMRPHEAASASVFFGAILLGVGGFVLFDLFGRKLPEKRHLESLLREYC
jgi:hypothetical protein